MDDIETAPFGWYNRLPNRNDHINQILNYYFRPFEHQFGIWKVLCHFNLVINGWSKAICRSNNGYNLWCFFSFLKAVAYNTVYRVNVELRVKQKLDVFKLCYHGIKLLLEMSVLASRRNTSKYNFVCALNHIKKHQ